MDVLRELDTALEAGAPFIPMKVAQWRMKPKWLDFRLEKYPDLPAIFRIHWAMEHAQ